MYDVAIIGCGIIGANTAYELSRYKLKVAVLEASNDVSNATTKANSAILHAGYDPEPGTLMARLNVAGVEMAKELCDKLDVERGQVGSLVLAFDEDDMNRVRRLFHNGEENGVPGIRILKKDEVIAMEPKVNKKVIGALYAPSAAIVSPWELCIALAEVAVENGAQLFLDSPATAIDKEADGSYTIHTPKGDFQARYVVNAAGCDADKIHEMVGGCGFVTQHNVGEYFLLDKTQNAMANHIIFQCPTKEGKGVLVAPTVHGNLIVGPNASPAKGSDDVANTAQGLDYVRRAAQKSVPGINFRENIRNFAGVRAQTDHDDFIIEESRQAKGFINLAGIKSPGLSAAPAIGAMAVELLQKAGLVTEKKDQFIDTRTRTIFRRMTPEQRREAIQDNPLYGRVVCRCETITEGEIVDAIRRPIVPTSIDAIKRRCNPGMGRCQGGFCGPRVHEILSRELGIPMDQIEMNEHGSYILTTPTKEAVV